MADTTASPLEGLLRATRGEGPGWGSLPGPGRPAAGLHPLRAEPLRAEPRAGLPPERAPRRDPSRPADRVPPRLTRSDPAPLPIFEARPQGSPAFEPLGDWGADSLALDWAPAGAALAGFGAAEGRRFRRARRGLFLGGGLLSLALVGLMGVWGYKVVLREVMGVPVVEAETGPMRVEPENPGGVITADTGLAVNAVAADGTAAPPSDVLTLAPPTAGLAAEDMAVTQTDAEAGEVRPQGTLEAAPEDAPEAIPASASIQLAALQAASAAVAQAMPSPREGPMSQADVLAMADAVAAIPVVEAAVTIPAAPAAPAPDAVASAPVPVVLVPAGTPGVAVAVRPPARPGGGTPAAAPSAQPEAVPEEVALTGAIPAGTSLVQLGAFDSPEVAAAEWERLQGPFGEFLYGKNRVIQEAESGGRTFFRLRALGFEDLADARRLCAALVAEEAGCIPVVVQ